jgi:hypothetical protein
MAMWNQAVYGANQAASIVLTSNSNNDRDESSLILKASGGTTTAPTNYIRVRYDNDLGNANGVIVEYTTNGGASFTTVGSKLSESLGANEVLYAAAYSDGAVAVYSINGGTTFVGSAQLPGGAVSTFAGTGGIGIRLGQTGATVDTFRGGSL